MGTPFNEIYVLFLSQIKDYDLAQMNDTTMEQNMQMWLTSSIGHFSSCQKDLRKHDLLTGHFDEVLTTEEKVILAKYMAYSYMLTHVITETNMKQTLNSKDYRMYSPANQLKALTSLRDHLNAEATTLESKYSYNHHDVKRFFK